MKRQFFITILFIFVVSITKSNAQDNCGVATPIVCGAVVSGNTTPFTVDVAPTCGTTNGTGGGLWYSILGTGSNITASLCGSSYDTKIRVYSGTCGSLVCTVGNDDFCGLQSEVTWASTAGVTYYILVHGYGGSQGAYTLTMTCAAPPPPTCYVINPVAYVPQPFAGTSLALADDVHSGVINIGFSFCYFGTTYTQCVISSNNYVTFDITEANQYSTWNTVAVPTALPTEVRNAILSPWQDINPASGGSIFYQTTGVAPNRIFVVSYLNVPMFSCTGLLYTSQIVLRESSNCIETHIDNKPLCASWNNGEAVHAIQNAAGNSVEIFVGRNNTPWTTTSEGSLWTPNCGVCQTTTSPVCLSILPIELLSFEANVNGNKVDIKWMTATEINNDFFTIERSADAQNWEEIITTNSAGNSNQILEYFETDYEPLEGVSYYRLKQTDFNGLFEYFNIVPVNYIEDVVDGMNLFPNFINAGEAVQIEFNNIIKDELLVVIRDIYGKEIYSKMMINIENGKLIGITINSDFPSGIYLITATSENQMYSKKLIVK
jgi:hypothetical protein